MNEVQEAILLGAKEIHNLREENSKQYKLLKKIKDLLKEYKYTNIEDYSRIMEFYRKLERLLEEIE